jgi:hypothetical protein
MKATGRGIQSGELLVRKKLTKVLGRLGTFSKVKGRA